MFAQKHIASSLLSVADHRWRIAVDQSGSTSAQRSSVDPIFFRRLNVEPGPAESVWKLFFYRWRRAGSLTNRVWQVKPALT